MTLTLIQFADGLGSTFSKMIPNFWPAARQAADDRV
jgi:hypothetical protein